MNRNKKEILIVENQRIIALDLKQMCNSIGHLCSHITFDNHAVRKAKELKPDLILMDMETDPGVDIIDKAEQICDMFHIPIIFFTRADPNSYIDHRLQDRCLFKAVPFNEEDLRDAIKTMLKKHANV